MFLKEIFKGHEDFTSQIKEARNWIKEADALVVIIGEGVSAAGGIDYMKPHIVKEYFKDYYRMGYRSLTELQEMYSQITDVNAKAYWGYWARYIKYIGYEKEIGNGYRDLLRLIRNKDYFIYTTNVDAQVQRAGFEEDRIFAPMGDCRWLRCSKACCNKLYESKELLDPMIKSMGGNLEVAANKVPRCQYCGEYLIPNIEFTSGMNIEECCKEKRKNVANIKSNEAYNQFIEKYSQGKVVYLELGVGLTKSAPLRTYFEEKVRQSTNTQLVRINKKEAELPEDLNTKTIGIKMDLEEAIANVASGVVSM